MPLSCPTPPMYLSGTQFVTGEAASAKPAASCARLSRPWIRPHCKVESLADLLPASDTLPQSLCHDTSPGLDRSGGVQADVFAVTRANKLHAHGITGHETDRDDSSWEAENVDRRHEPQVVPEQRMDARIAAEIGIRLRRPLHRERREDHRIRLEEGEPAAQDAGSGSDSLHVTAPVEDRRHLQKAVECLPEVGAAEFAHLRLLQHRKLGHDEVAPKFPGTCQIGQLRFDDVVSGVDEMAGGGAQQGEN